MVKLEVWSLGMWLRGGVLAYRAQGPRGLKWKLKDSLESQLDGVLLGLTREGMFR